MRLGPPSHPHCVLALLALGAVAVMPGAAGQAHDHLASAGVVIAHDVAPDGATYVGNLNHFVVLYLGADDEPDFHQQNHVRVTLDGAVVFATTADSGHDYDGVYGFDVAFGRPGRYAVEVLQDDAVQARFEGNVTPAPEVAGPPGLEVTPPSGTLPGNMPQVTAFNFTYAARSNGSVLAHSDAVLEVFRDQTSLTAGQTYATTPQLLALRLKTHTHQADELQSVQAAFPLGAYTARAATYLSFPTPGDSFFRPAAETAELVAFSGPLPADAPMEVAAPVGQNVVVRGTGGDGLTLLGTFDPYDVVGPGTLQHLAAVVLDPATGRTRQHVDFEATLIGPLGVVLRSDTLHEYDGVLEIETMQPLPGAYRLVVDAKAGDWTGHVELPYRVVGGAGTIAAGPQLVRLQGPDMPRAGEVGRFVFRITDPSGVAAFQHGEVDVVVDRVTRAGDLFGVPVLRAKLHTHGSGEFAFDLAFPEAGDYVVRATPYPLGAAPTPQYWGEAVGGDLAWGVAVAPGDEPAPELAPGDGEPAQGAPLLPAAWLAVALAALAASSRRR